MSKRGEIIVIEDDLDDQVILKEALDELEVKNHLQFFVDPEEAYGYLMSMSGKPFLILCDINLPKLSGIELKKKIDSTDYLKKKAIPFIFLTTADEQKHIDRAYDLTNLQGYFRKGQSLEEIKEKIKTILDYWTVSLHPSDK